MHPEAIIFDMDGVLIDSGKCSYMLLSDCLQKHGIALTITDMLNWAGSSDEDFWREIKKNHGLSESVENLMASYDYDKEIAAYEALGLMPGVRRVLDMIDAAALSIGLATGASMKRVEEVLRIGEITHLFTSIICAEDVTQYKPHPECYLKACESLKVKPEETLVVEDSSQGAKAARRAGCSVAAFKGMMWQFDPFEADIQIESFEDIRHIDQLRNF